MQSINDEKGLTLIEVLASLIVIMIIIVIGFGLLLQSAKPNKASEEIVDATYGCTNGNGKHLSCK